MTTQQALAHPWIVKYAPQPQEAVVAEDPQKADNNSTIPENAPAEADSAETAQTENNEANTENNEPNTENNEASTENTANAESADSTQAKQKTDPELSVPQQLKK